MRSKTPLRDVLALLEARSFHDPNSGCQIWEGGVDRYGYGQITVLPGVSRTHRAAWILNFGPIQKGLCVLHKCDTPSCIRPDHLFLGSVARNNADRSAKGRDAIGADNGNAKLTPEIVRSIRQSAETNKALADRFGVASSSVSNVRNRVTWNWLT